MTLVIDYAYWPRLPHQPHLPRLPGLPHLPFTCLAYLAYLAFLAYIAYAYRVGDEVNWKENLLVYVNNIHWICILVQMYWCEFALECKCIWSKVGVEAVQCVTILTLMAAREGRRRPFVKLFLEEGLIWQWWGKLLFYAPDSLKVTMVSEWVLVK